MTPHMLLADPDTLAQLRALRAEVAEVRALLARATIQPAPEWVSVSEAAWLLECSTDTIRRRIAAGELEAQGAGKARRVKVK